MTANRLTLPEYFYDVTSARLLLDPEPMYLYAALFKSALGVALDKSGGMGRTMLPGGGPSEDHEAGALVMSDPIYNETITVVSELGAVPGHTVRLNRPIFQDTTYTEASRQIAGTDISTVPIDVSAEQVPITLKKFVGPYDQTNSRPAPFAIDAFDAQMAVAPLAAKIGAQLARDFDKFIDSVMVAKMNGGANTVRPDGFTADNDHATANMGTMDVETLFKAQRTLEDLHIPTFGNGQYACVLKPKQLQDLKTDPTFRSLAENQAPIHPVLKKNYVASVGGLDIFKSSTLTTTANASSVDVFTGHVFGPGVLGAGTGRPPRVAPSTDDNYGETAKCVWILDAGWTLLDNRFCALVKTA